ncbi:MAG: hypothetical protein IAG13_38985 [Deltaproteobacteria bacterium]|nr:hypothetical protein [Nannocystaceae bacterium]
MTPTQDPIPQGRLSKDPWSLVRQTMGDPRAFAVKLRHLAVALHGYGRSELVDARLRRLVELGHIEVIPTRLQRMVGALDMARFFIVPCAADYYASKGLDFRFHTFLRFLDDPASVIDPTGFNSTRDAIIGHVMQVVHANPHYDFQLLESFPDGLDQMEQQVADVLNGRHPRAASILAIVEDPRYHERLLEHIRAFRSDPTVPPLLRENISSNPRFAAAERSFGTVPNAMRYFAKLPKTAIAAAHHLLTVREFPAELAPTDPKPAAEHRLAAAR